MTRLAQELPSWGAGRFQVRRTLGAGVSGVVYEVHDRVRDARLALKALHGPTREGIARLSREFRALELLRHRNLVTLDELIEEDGQWFFTMELVEPWDFLSFAATPGEAHREPGLCYDEARLKLVLTQLASGLLALHGAGKLHRAVKPANALVTREGRLVLVDCGSSGELERAPDFTAEHASTSARYLSPEQAAGRPVGPEADWYAVGALLYHALTGRPAFTGAALSVLLEKQRQLPPAPHTLVRGASPELSTLAMDLLRIEPSLRPSGAEVVQRLGGSLSHIDALPRPADVVSFDRARATRISTLTHEPDAMFVGRETELATLEDALASVKRGQQAIAYVQGPSGVGKSALLRAFAQRAARSGALVLAGRCHEGESAPYKALDGVMESLIELFRGREKHRAASLVPRRGSLLVRVFPALTRVSPFGFASEQRAVCPEELRAQLDEAFRELFVRLCERHTVIVSLDDLPWSDGESLRLLSELFGAELAPPLLLIGSRPDEPAPEGPCQKPYGLPAATHTITLGPLATGEALSLAHKALELAGRDVAQAGQVVEQARAHPRFVEELARFACAPSSGPPASVEDALAVRIAALPPELRSLLEFLAISGAPLALTTLACASGVSTSEVARQLATLRAMALVRTHGNKAHEAAELQHVSVRKAVRASLDPSGEKQLHLGLVRALRHSGHGDFERLAQHYRASEQEAEALEHTLRAAEQAEHALAFEHAARLYALALPMVPAHSDAARATLVRRGQTLARAGQGTLAAQAYLQAAEGAEAHAAGELRRRAAEQLIQGGQLERGLSALHQALADEGIAVPRSERRAAWSLGLGGLVQRLRGRSFERRDEIDVPEEARRKADLCHGAALTMGTLDPTRGTWLSMRAVEHARRTGDPYRVARALSVHVGQLCRTGRQAENKVDVLLNEAEALAAEADSAHALAVAMAARAQVRLLAGRFRAAVQCATEAERVLREQCVDVQRELEAVRSTGLRALLFLGEYGEVNGRIPALLSACHKRGDVLGSASLRAAVHGPSLLVRGHVEAARESLYAAERGLRGQAFGMQQHDLLLARIELALCEGSLLEAEQLAVEHARELSESGLARVQLCRVSLFHACGRVALTRACNGGDASDLRDAAHFAGRLQRERTPWAQALGQLLLSGVDMHGRAADRARAKLEHALAGFEASELRLHAAGTRLLLGKLTDHAAGLAMIDQARAYFELQRLPMERAVALIAPGFDP